MFNVFQYDREVELQTQEQEFRRSQSMLQQRKVQKNSILIQNYNARVEKFLKTTIVKPVVHQDHIPPLQVVPRPSDPSKFKGGACFIMKGFKTEKQRIKEALENNQILDTNPIQSSFTRSVPKSHKYLIRKPEPAKKIHKFPVLNIRPKGSDSSESEHDESHSSSASKIKALSQTQVPKTLKKTHFKALMQKLVQEDYFGDIEKRTTSAFINFPARTIQPLLALIQHSSSKLRFLGRPLSLQVLENCNIIMPKAKTRFLKKGQGHLMVSLENPGNKD